MFWLFKNRYHVWQICDSARSARDWQHHGIEQDGGRWNLAPQILIDDYDILTVRGQDLRKLISTIPQEPFLFEGSIKDNIMKGLENINFSGFDDGVLEGVNVFPTPEMLIFKNRVRIW